MDRSIINGTSMDECLKRNDLFLQRIIYILSLALGVDVAIIDSSLRLCAGTGPYLFKKDEVYGENSASYLIIKKGDPIVIRNPRDNPICRNCANRETCTEFGSISYPITGNNILGSVAVVATTKMQFNNLVSNENDLLYILSKVSNLISNLLCGIDINKQVKNLERQLDTINASVQEGILYFNQRGKVIYSNPAASVLLNMRPQDLVGQTLNTLFKEGDSLLYDSNYFNKRIFTSNFDPSIKYPGTSTIFMQNENKHCPGLIVTLRDRYQSRDEVNSNIGVSFENILGISNAIVSVKEKARRVAKGHSTVLINGESGTGKELLARAVHGASDRKDGPFISLNCSAIPPGMLESELFGYEEGAFTGARKGGKPGKFELASNGTIFLDEIGDMPLAQQAKILRVLEEQEVDRLGGTLPYKVDARVIAATNKDLKELVKRGDFRKDLYYRLNIIPLEMPPLRDRLEDIAVYVDYFIKEFNNTLKRDIKGIAPDTMGRLMSYSWPGNVRQLRNVIEYAVNIATEPYIYIYDLPDHFLSSATSARKDRGKIRAIKDAEIDLIRKALLEFGTDTEGKKRAAQYLGISLSTLYRKLNSNKLNIN